MLVAYGWARTAAEKAQADGNKRRAWSSMKSAAEALTAIGLTPESRRRAIKNAHARRASV